MKVGVIGGGPAGMMAAYAAAEYCSVTLLEKNEKLGKKLFITGKGRCNITNDCNIEMLFQRVVRNSKFMFSSFYTFSNHMMMNLLEENKLRLKTERGGRVFPESDKSSDVIKCYERLLARRGVEICLNTKVFSIEKKGEGFLINGTYFFDRIIIATGGCTYCSTGSTGDGYIFAKKLGHRVTELKPGLVPLKSKDSSLQALQGLSLKNVNLIAKSKGKVIGKEFGEMIFTHFGYSGPIVLSMSSQINRFDDIELFLDFKPALEKEKLEDRILRDFQKSPNKSIKNTLENLLPRDVIPILLNRGKISPFKVTHQISKKERENILEEIKQFNLFYEGLFDFNAAIITSGGVQTDEINPSTMESLIVPGLYFAGEIIDVDALTGGFNLQIANSTGFLAGQCAGNEI